MSRPTAERIARAVPIDGAVRRIWVDLLLYPSHTFPTAAAPIFVAVGLAVHERVASPLVAILAFIASWAIHVGGVFVDNYVLITRHRQVPEHPELLAALDDGSLTLRGLRLAIAGSFALALLVAAPLASAIGWPMVVVFGAIGAVASIGYAGGPLPYAQLGIADPVFFAMFGFVAVPAAYLAQATAGDAGSVAGLLDSVRALPASVYLAGIPVAALVTNVLLIDEIRDADYDRAKGWRSGAVRWGRGFTRAELCALTVLAYAVPFWLWLRSGYTAAVLLPLLTLPMAVTVARGVWKARRFEELFPMTPRASRLAMIYGMLAGLGLSIR